MMPPDVDRFAVTRRAGRIVAWAACMVAYLLLAFASASAMAQQISDVDTALDAARKQIDDVQKGLKGQPEDADLSRFRSVAQDVQNQSDATVETLSPQLTSVQARLQELGPAPAGAKEAADVASQRAQLTKGAAALDAQVKLARLLSVEAAQVADQISTVRRADFQARMGERRASILDPTFWADLHSDMPKDMVRLRTLLVELSAAIRVTPGAVWVGAVLAMVLLVMLRMWIGQWLVRVTATRLPPGRLRRSFLAVTLIALSVALPALIAELLHVSLNWDAQLSDSTESLAKGLVGTVCFGGYLAGLGYALLSPDRPSWRLPAIADAVAVRMRWFPFVLAVVIVLVWLAERLASALNTSLTTTVVTNCVAALVLAVTMGLALLRAERGRRQTRQEAGETRPLWLSAFIMAVWVALAVSVLCVLIGYVAFGSFIVKQMVWGMVVLTSAYLFIVLIEDVLGLLLGATRSDAGKEDEAPQARARDQAVVLLSGVGRLLVALFALLLLLAPFGEGPVELLHRMDQFHDGITLGEVQILPASVLQAFVVLGLCLAGIRLLKSWLNDSYLPTTSLDPGMRLSAVTLFGYVGVVVAVGLSMAALGIGLERVAWVASALSVGIGFGLQAVVQNFVSGLILLAERPVKVGDWVSLGGIEGDIRRINVRATEIQMGDRSTVIVPNSEFITKTVRNVTHANPLGLVQIKLPVPLSTDAERVRNLMLESFNAHSDMLDTPAPNVFLDGIEGDHLVFNATGFVGSPRQAYGVRSAVLFDVLKRMAQEELAMWKPATMVFAGQPPAQTADGDADALVK